MLVAGFVVHLVLLLKAKPAVALESSGRALSWR
jgi:hypothetical protein